jgi:hypothetical protein
LSFHLRLLNNRLESSNFSCDTYSYWYFHLFYVFKMLRSIILFPR